MGNGVTSRTPSYGSTSLFVAGPRRGLTRFRPWSDLKSRLPATPLSKPPDRWIRRAVLRCEIRSRCDVDQLVYDGFINRWLDVSKRSPAGKRAGITVSIGARVASMAAPSEVLVSQTVKDLVAGSGFSFEDSGEHELKGVPDR